MSRWLFVLCVAGAAFLGVAECTLRVDPNVDPPQINIGCVVVQIGSNQIEQCPDAGKDGAK